MSFILFLLTGRRLCEGFCLLQNRQMYEVPQGEYIALESRRPDVRKPKLWAVIGRDFVHRAACWRRSGLERRNFQLCTNVAKPFLYLLIYTFPANKKRFCGIEVQKFNLALNPLFCQHDVTCSAFIY